MHGDLIVAVDGNECRSEDVLAHAIDRVGPGGKLRLSVVRGSSDYEITVTGATISAEARAASGVRRR